MKDKTMKIMQEMITEFERVRREYPALVHNATVVSLNTIDETLEIIRHGVTSDCRQRASESQELGWSRVEHKYGVDWVGKTGMTTFKLFCAENSKPAPDTDKDLGPVEFLPPTWVIEPEDLSDAMDNLNKLGHEQLTAN